MRITFIGFGEVAGAFSGALASRGADIASYDVLLAQPDGLERLRARAGAAGVSFLPLADALYGAKYILSTVTRTVASAAAKECAAHLKPGQTFIDLNATEPEAKKDIAKTIEASGASVAVGATLAAVATRLTEANMQVVGAATLAATRLRRARRHSRAQLPPHVAARVKSPRIGAPNEG